MKSEMQAIDAFNAAVCVERSRGDLTLTTVLADARVADHAGQCRFRSVEGSVELLDARSSGLQLRTKRGRIRFSGLVMPESSYELRTRSGDITVALHPASDCGLFAESREGAAVWAHPAERWNMDGDPRRIYANLRSGSGGFHACSETGSVTVASLEPASRPTLPDR